MSQITLIEKIKADAMATVADIKTAGEAQVEIVQREVEDAIATDKKEREALLEKQLENLELVALSKAKQAGKIAVQSAKREQIDSLFSKVVAEYADLTPGKYVEFFEKHITEVIPKDVKILEVSAPPNRLDETKELVKEFGFSGDVKSDSKYKAGLVVRAEDGVYDITLERIVNEKRADLEIKVMQKIAE